MSGFSVPAPEVFEGAPRYFRRVYDRRGLPGRSGPVIDPLAGERLVIYGYSARSSFVEDRAVEDRAWAERGVFPAVSFSVLTVDGEYGSVPLAAVEEVDEATFEAARARGFADAGNTV